MFTKLGLTSFGGPVAHLGYFRNELIERRGWTDDQSYTDLVALCQFLPGPASSQTGIGLGIARAGIPGGFAAWLGFTLPSAFALIAFALGVSALGDVSGAGWLQGLKIVAVAVVAHALWGMATKLTPDRPRVTLAVLAAAAALVWPTSFAQVGIILLGGLVGWRLLPAGPVTPRQSPPFRIRRRVGALLLVVFFGLLVGLPLLRDATGSFEVAVFDAFYRAGSLVFGGGHVVLPLLQAEVVPPGWVDNATFTAGYGAAQAVPGPLFTFSAFLGAAAQPGLGGLWTGLLALVAVFVPSFLLLLGVLPLLGQAAAVVPRSGGAARGQRGGGRYSARRALYPGLDERDPDGHGLCRGARGVFGARLLAVACVAGRTPHRPGRGRRRCPRIGPHLEERHLAFGPAGFWEATPAPRVYLLRPSRIGFRPRPVDTSAYRDGRPATIGHAPKTE